MLSGLGWCFSGRRLREVPSLPWSLSSAGGYDKRHFQTIHLPRSIQVREEAINRAKILDRLACMGSKKSSPTSTTITPTLLEARPPGANLVDPFAGPIWWTSLVYRLCVPFWRTNRACVRLRRYLPNNDAPTFSGWKEELKEVEVRADKLSSEGFLAEVF